MDSDPEDSSTSDEEYIPPSKLTKKDQCDSDTSDSEVEVDSEDSFETDSVKDKQKDLQDNSQKITGHQDELSESERKAKEHALWQEFLATADQPAPKVTAETVTVTKKYQFAGEEVEVTERVPSSKSPLQSDPTNSTASTSVPNSNSGLIIGKTKPPSNNAKHTIPAKSNLSSALQNLKSLADNKPPKLTTLEKSRLDWQAFVQAENIEDDLRAHNKGKEGYLERRAFVNRTAEREFDYQRSLKTRKH